LLWGDLGSCSTAGFDESLELSGAELLKAASVGSCLKLV